MSETIIVAVIAFIGTLGGSYLTANSTKKAMQVEIDSLKKGLDRLEEKQNKHNNLIERMVVVEQSCVATKQRLGFLEAHLNI